MDSSATIRTGEHSSNHNIVKNEPSEGKTIGFAIVIILGFGSLVVAGVGLGGYLQAGSLSSIGQVNSIIMMAAGGGGGIVFLVVGIVGSVKNCQGSGRRQNDGNEGIKDGTNTVNIDHNPKPVKNVKDVVSTVGTHGELIYGPDAWQAWNVEVLDKVPEAPKVDLSKKDKILLYIPRRIRVDDKEKDLNLEALKEIKDDAFKYFNPVIKEKFKKTTAVGWVLIDKAVLESQSEDYGIQKKRVEEKGCQRLRALEAIVLILMVFDRTGVRLCSQDSRTYICCTEMIDGKHVIVGCFDAEGLDVCDDSILLDKDILVEACALRE